MHSLSVIGNVISVHICLYILLTVFIRHYDVTILYTVSLYNLKVSQSIERLQFVYYPFILHVQFLVPDNEELQALNAYSKGDDRIISSLMKINRAEAEAYKAL